MNFKRFFLITLIIPILVLTMVSISFSQMKGKFLYSFLGTIESISKDLRVLEANEGRVQMTSATEILDEDGMVLRVDALKPGLLVSIKALRTSQGLIAQEIVVKSSNRKP